MCNIRGVSSACSYKAPLTTRLLHLVSLPLLSHRSQLCALLDALLLTDNPRLADPQVIESLFIFCVLWSIGATLVQQHEAPVSAAASASCMLQVDPMQVQTPPSQLYTQAVV